VNEPGSPPRLAGTLFVFSGGGVMISIRAIAIVAMATVISTPGLRTSDRVPLHAGPTNPSPGALATGVCIPGDSERSGDGSERSACVASRASKPRIGAIGHRARSRMGTARHRL